MRSLLYRKVCSIKIRRDVLLGLNDANVSRRFGKALFLMSLGGSPKLKLTFKEVTISSNFTCGPWSWLAYIVHHIIVLTCSCCCNISTWFDFCVSCAIRFCTHSAVVMGDGNMSAGHGTQHYDPNRGCRVGSATYYNESTRVRRASITNIIELGRLRRHVAVLDREAIRSISLIDRDMRLLCSALDRVRMSSGRSVIDSTGLPDHSSTPPRCILYGERPPTTGRRRIPVARCRPQVAPSLSLSLGKEEPLSSANRKLASGRGHLDWGSFGASWWCYDRDWRRMYC